MPVTNRPAEALGDARIGTKRRRDRPAPAVADGGANVVRHMAAARPRPRGPRGQRRLDGAGHHRLAVDLGQQLVRPAHAARPAGGEHAGPPLCGAWEERVAHRSARGCGRVAISISSPPAPMRMISPAVDRQIGDQPPQHPVEAVAPWASGRSRAAPARAARRARPGAADCRDRPACRNAGPRRRRRSIAAGITSRRSTIAEAPAMSRSRGLGLSPDGGGDDRRRA